MKTFLTDSFSEGKPKSWFFLADSALSNAGKPFFLPDQKVSAALAIAFRFARLGKTIAPKFAARYIDTWAPAINFRLESLYNLLDEASLPTDPAVSFDKSLFYGDFIKIDLDNDFLSNNQPFPAQGNFFIRKNHRTQETESHRFEQSSIEFKDIDEQEISLCLNSEALDSVNPNYLFSIIPDSVAEISKLNTIKNGDLFVVVSPNRFEIQLNDFLEAKEKDASKLSVKIK